MSAADPEGDWTAVCALDDLALDRGVCALVDGAPVAVFRCAPGGELFAIGNHDPYCDASVLSRGLVGTLVTDDIVITYVASPMRKHRFDLRSGRALDDPTVSVGTWAIRDHDGTIEVARTGSSWRNDLETDT